DSDARSRLEQWARQNDDIRALYGDPAGAPVPERLRDALRGEPLARRRGAGPWRYVAAALMFLAIGGAGGWLARDVIAPAGSTDMFAEAAIAAHDTYVVEVVHPVEVTADERDHMDTWMSKRLGTEIRPPDLSTAGYRLLGGRILPAGDRPAGLYMYENAGGQRITLYIAHQPGGASSAFRYREAGRTQSLEWADGGLGFALVGDVPRDRLRAVAKDAYDQLL
ncbi:MAG: anti-sigma factor family protein, partial [Marinibacterium sp.]